MAGLAGQDGVSASPGLDADGDTDPTDADLDLSGLVTVVPFGEDDAPYLSDSWVWGVLALMIVFCILALFVCVMVRRKVLRESHDEEEEFKVDLDLEAALPSYTIVSGLPTYDEALDQLQRMRQLRRSSSAQKAIETAVAAAMAAGNLVAVRRLQHMRQLSVGELIQYSYRSNSFDKS